ncbi:Chondroitin sulfate glucuronyltransferase [Eumeta japonica]|uniref:Hexosyltransferase n=1 Tax=Eumeta variegata TaxID=151549 RepID=A0A4C1TQS5_EUMVA|nr:Chondroitin sulfate glucuronyltransferase [Eumeta japonica]
MLSRYVASQVKHNGYFLLGLAVGLYVALVCVPLDDGAAETLLDCVSDTSISAAPVDDYEPQRTEARGQGVAPVAAPARSVQRPRYYSTELGIRERLFVGVLSSEEALSGRAAALNRTVAHLLPALKFFVTASATRRASLPNVVGFTDTREMLKPFHVLKYVTDNYLDEYDFFFLVGDTSFVNARRLLQLVRGLGVSHNLYMGVADDDSPYCSLEHGILLSNGVLRSVQGALDWCVRNAYSRHHHENLGRCIQHTTQLSCIDTMQVLHITL